MKYTKTKQPRKQRKRYYNAPLHLRNRQMTHKDDKVIVFRAKSEDQEIKGKVLRVLPQKYSVHIEGHSKEKADGTITSFPVHPSNILITSLNLRDKKRRDIIKRRSKKEITEEELTEDLFDEFEEPLEETDIEDEDLDEDVFEEFEDLDEAVVTEEVVKTTPKKEVKVPDIDVSMIKGVGAKTAMLLKENGFDTVDKISKATPEDLSKVPGIGPGTAKTMIANAEDLLSKKADKKEESS
jgi:large subunit ribosomal protein L24